MRSLRADTLRLFDELSDAQLDAPALPRWTVADVFRHLADSDRGSVLGKHLLEFLPGRDLEGEFQEHNDANLAALRDRDRDHLRRELERWGARMARIVELVPGLVASIRVPTAFGRVPVAWLAGLRLFDEWVHQVDVVAALRLEDRGMRPDLAELLAPWHLVAFEADALARVVGRGVVEVSFDDAGARARYRLEGRRPLPDPSSWSGDPDARIVTDVGSWCLLAADRATVDELCTDGRVKVDGDEQAARALLDVVRVV